jgi:hypothetical protein
MVNGQEEKRFLYVPFTIYYLLLFFLLCSLAALDLIA